MIKTALSQEKSAFRNLLRSYPGYAEAVHRADGLNGLFAQATGALRDVYDFMRFSQLAQTDFLFQFFDLSWMNDSLLTGLCLTPFHSRLGK